MKAKLDSPERIADYITSHVKLFPSTLKMTSVVYPAYTGSDAFEIRITKGNFDLISLVPKDIDEIVRLATNEGFTFEGIRIWTYTEKNIKNKRTELALGFRR